MEPRWKGFPTTTLPPTIYITTITTVRLRMSPLRPVLLPPVGVKAFASGITIMMVGKICSLRITGRTVSIIMTMEFSPKWLKKLAWQDQERPGALAALSLITTVTGASTSWWQIMWISIYPQFRTRAREVLAYGRA